MPALRLLGRRWLVATDDLVFPGLFEFVYRLIWLVLVALVAWSLGAGWGWGGGGGGAGATCTDEEGGAAVRAYLCGELLLIALAMALLAALVNRSAQGSVMDARARRHVPALLTAKVLLIVPEVAWNILGTLWAFSDTVQCSNEEGFTKAVIEAMVLFNWVQLALTLLGLALVFDPLGSSRLVAPAPPPPPPSPGADGDAPPQEDPAQEEARHRRLTSLWIRRFQWVFCWVRRDEHCHEAFQHIASLFSALLRNTDIVPSDMMAALVLLRVMQKRETRELRRLQLLEKDQPKYYLDTREVFAETPSWMSLDHALHFLKMSMAAYGWPFVMYQYPATGLFRMCPHMTCCACFRCKATEVKDDNCCLCHLAGVRYTSQVDYEDIIYASFSNDMCQLPFFVLADHKTSSIAIVVRGSISLRDVFTDLIAGADLFEAPGLPENSMAHRGISLAAYYILKTLETSGALEKAFILYPHYKLVLTGHSLGAGVSVLLALLLRPRYPDLKVYAISPPAGLLSREAARVTEEFTFSVGIGDDFVMRLSVDSIENIRTNALRVLKFCKLPKYRIMLNGFGYAIFGIPTRDLESTWKNDLPTPSTPGQLPLLLNTPPTSSSDDSLLFVRDISQRRFSRTHLYIPGKILHITRRKKTKQERKTNTGGPTYEMRWAVAEEFTEFRIMPRMILDHLPDNIYKAFETVLDEQKQIRKRVPTVAVL
ncbi:hypothetical protein R5R35_003811 [Gryllus longicercus]|uniref:sn-1-specific diacylglycerol lipase n=1 Tax=Gryllus longicercus TaxID=2509291 RepID=A0AAN9VPY5_9ORTH